MLELLFTSFPVIIRYYQLRRRGESMTVWNMRTAVFLWAVLAFFLFVVIFYFHPKSYSGLVPFRTASIVAQTSGPVTEIAVQNWQRVSAGDLLFRIENSAQKATLKQAEAELDRIAAAESKAIDALKVAQASVVESGASLEKLRGDLKNAQALFARNAGTKDTVRIAESAFQIGEADLAAAQAQLSLAQLEISQSLPAQRKVTETAVESARVALSMTEVRSFTDGVVTQLSLSVGSPASTLILSPAMVIIPDRPDDLPLRITAGFSQVTRTTIYEGMPAEIACDSNIGLSFSNTVLPARVVHIQPAISTGQIVPGGRLVELNARAPRGSLLVYLELEHKEQEKIMLDGTGCIVQTYTNNLGGFTGHLIAATGVIKAVGLRLKVWGALIAGIGLAGNGGH
ncbi:biotin/lipoyl-binding protein [Brucella tritici]|uniref:Biotin/lipoyl-binding protein n=1 Tax=Brucella tritici TaxID=94626 RepID=A0A6N6QDC7_9HYPH|nr:MULTISPECIES: biotin/lipoyl-binding protein [Brucella]KAB2671435.1 biotin/lipoyl-binding protein [Brucella tritici]KAB2674386.1 biotin/lipoyl-binding protein [Brucella tritici]UVV70771.1 biotin/lipoyl-binding protein [Brucella anthropi]